MFLRQGKNLIFGSIGGFIVNRYSSIRSKARTLEGTGSNVASSIFQIPVRDVARGVASACPVNDYEVVLVERGALGTGEEHSSGKRALTE